MFFPLETQLKNSLAGERPGRKKGYMEYSIISQHWGTSLKFPSSYKFIVQVWCELFMNFGWKMIIYSLAEFWPESPFVLTSNVSRRIFFAPKKTN